MSNLRMRLLVSRAVSAYEAWDEALSEVEECLTPEQLDELAGLGGIDYMQRLKSFVPDWNQKRI